MSNGAMIGMLTFREVLGELNARAGNLGDAQAGAVMVKEPITGNPTDSVDHLREVMLDNHIRYLPVTEGEQLLGVISFHDVAKAVIKQTNFENRLLKRYIKNWPEEEDKK
jgi:CBS domain-containing protein